MHIPPKIQRYSSSLIILIYEKVSESPVFIDQMGHGGCFAVMRWRVAFQDKPRELWWDQQVEWDQQKNNGRGYSPKVDEHGVPTAVAIMRRQVFDPFFKAWSEQ